MQITVSQVVKGDPDVHHGSSSKDGPGLRTGKDVEALPS